MLEQIVELIKQFGQDEVVNNPGVPNEKNSEVLAEATNTITSGMQNVLAGGGLQNIISLFTGGDRNNTANAQTAGIGGLLKNPIVAMMIGHFISKLVGKFNMNPAQASNISNNLIPNVLNDLITKTRSSDPSNDAFDLNDLMSSLTGGKPEQSTGGFNFQGFLDQVIQGGGEDRGLNLEDITSQVTQEAQQKQERPAIDLLKGFFS